MCIRHSISRWLDFLFFYPSKKLQCCLTCAMCTSFLATVNGIAQQVLFCQLDATCAGKGPCIIQSPVRTMNITGRYLCLSYQLSSTSIVLDLTLLFENGTISNSESFVPWYAGSLSYLLRCIHIHDVNVNLILQVKVTSHLPSPSAVEWALILKS